MEQLNSFQELDDQQFRDMLAVFEDYYANDVALITDDVYDYLVEYYRKKFGPYEKVGAPPRGDGTNLPYPMMSLNKINEPEAILRFQNKYPGPYLVEDKIDGISVLYITGSKPKLYTRGGGIVGDDRSFLLRYLNIPKLSQRVAVRGELYMPKESFEQNRGEYSTPLSMTTGITRANDGSNDPFCLGLLKLRAYRLFETSVDSYQERQLLIQLGFEVPNFVVLDTINHELLLDVYDRQNQVAEYEMDGLVIYPLSIVQEVSSENPKNIMAFKPPTETAIVRVKQIVWGSGTWRGVLVPVVNYEETHLSGGNLQNATLFNARMVLEKRIGPGAMIQIIRSGKSIPHVIAVISPAPDGPQMPTISYRWDENRVNIISLEVTPEMVADHIVRFLRTIGVKTFGKERVLKLIRWGLVRSLDDFLALSPEMVSQVDGFQDLPAVFFSELFTRLGDIELDLLAVASGIFPGIGLKRWKDITEAIPNILELPYNTEQLIEILQRIRGIAELARIVAERLPEFRQWIARNPRIRIKKITRQNGQLQNRVFVFTGVRDPALAEKLRNLGAIIDENVTLKTTDLIYKTQGTGSYQKALKYAEKHPIRFHYYQNFQLESIL